MAKDPVTVSINNREAFGLAVFLLQAVRPEGRAEERTYNRIFDELWLEPYREEATAAGAVGFLMARSVEPASERTLSRAGADFVVLSWDKIKGKHGALVAVCLPLIERIEAANRAE